MEERVNYQSSGSYSTLNRFGEETKNVWLVFHGLGFLSRYFIDLFTDFNPKENYFIAPQAPSKYYQKEFKYVGACWLTKENTKDEIINVLGYVDALYQAEINKIKKSDFNLIVLGYSQGVSIATRWLARNKSITVKKLILHSGGLPQELEREDLKHLHPAKAYLVYGDRDQYLNQERVEEEKKRAFKLFGESLIVNEYKGIHEVRVDVIRDLVKNL